jgi:hypothetical protein
MTNRQRIEQLRNLAQRICSEVPLLEKEDIDRGNGMRTMHEELDDALTNAEWGLREVLRWAERHKAVL